MFEGKRLHEAVEETERRAKAFRLGAIDRVLTTLGKEAGDILIIAMTLGILCAPVGLGLCVIWITGLVIGTFSGSDVLGWVAGIGMFAFLWRYVWGARLQSAAKRAAAALVGSR